jgi:vancomycin resistance protein YoaR
MEPSERNLSVTNIRRAAQLLDGFVIAPGGHFSMNDALGRRTRARGFVPAPMISGGRFVDSLGGGIGQVAATLYNAAFFAGLQLVAHAPHRYYVPRYPKDREATISWDGPELILRNDWPTAVRIRLRATTTRVTAQIISERAGRHVRSWMGEPHAIQQRTVRIIKNPGLRHGTRRVVQAAGQPGFTIEYGRTVLRTARLVRSERWRVRYYAQNKIIEVGTQ